MSRVKPLMILLAVVGLSLGASPALAESVGWNAWGVHGVTASDDGSGSISFADSGTAYHWQDSTASDIRQGGKSFYSTSYLNGSLVSAITSLTWTPHSNPGVADETPYVNILIGDGTGTAILSPKIRGEDGTGDTWTTGMKFDVYEVTGLALAAVVDWNDVKDMTIIGGGQQLCPATVIGGPGTADYTDRAANWNYWGNGAELDGISFVWGSRKLKDLFDGKTAIISGISLNGRDSHTIPEPSSVAALIGLLATGGGLWLGRRRRRATRAPWSEESRQAIRQIIDHGRTSA